MSGCNDVWESNWYGWLANELETLGSFSQVILRNMPEPDTAPEASWLPFIRREMSPDENTIVVGHSSGAVAAMRLMEETKLLGCVLVAAYYSDLESEHEAASGYFSRPWDWEAMRSNVNWVVQFHSEVTFYNLRVLDYHYLMQCLLTVAGIQEDPLVPLREAE